MFALMFSHLLSAIESKTATVAVIGLGYVGLPLVSVIHKSGFSCIGLDVDQQKVDLLKEKKSYIHHIPHTLVSELMESGRFSPTTQFSDLKKAHVIIMCVPTPLSKYRDPDMSFVESTANSIGHHLQKGQLVILESTTYPGTCREVIQPILENLSGLKAGEDFFIAYSPEREDPGNASFSTVKIPKVVGGLDEQSLKLATTLYDSFGIHTVPVSSLDTAEAVKLTENIFRSVNIALVNELKVVFDAMGIDVWEVIEAAKTKPFGFMPFYPGPGLGGHCIPIDPFYLTWKAREFGLSTHFIELAGEVNTSMPDYVVQKLRHALDQRFQKSLKGSRVLIAGVAYKKNVDDARESPAFVIMEKLQDMGVQLSYTDPFVPEIQPSREHPTLTGLKSTPLTAEHLQSVDAVLIVTDHDHVDYNLMANHAPLIVDSRHAMGAIKDPKLRKKIVRA